MKPNHKLALIVSYYLSKFDRKALGYLGFENFTQAFREIGDKLNIKPNTIKNMRENFDPLHPNRRVGWYQRELSISRLEVLEKYGVLGEEALSAIVKDILEKYKSDVEKIDEDFRTYVNVIENDEGDNLPSNREYTTRGITGKKAEELFIEIFRNGQIDGLTGNLIDRRNDGCGYDFEMEDDPKYIFEIKGLSDISGGVIFTDKEWNTAKFLGDRYVLVLISNIKENAIISIYKNPYKNFNASKRVFTTIAVNWSVESSQLFI